MDVNKVIEGQTALVTGASSGIGEQIARAMAAAGAGVIVNYRSSEQAARRIAAEIRDAGGRARTFQSDVSSEEQVEKMFRFAVETFGTVDILVSNSGIQKDTAFLDMTLQEWEKVIAVNLTGAFLCARAAAHEFLRRGMVPERSCATGKIIFTGSVHDAIPWAGHANYTASKGGLTMLMKSLAQELAVYKIRVNSIAPGAIKTAINRKTWEDPEGERKMVKLIPYGRVGEVGDIAPAAVWLASDAADYITGITLYIDGGMMLYPGFRTGG